MTFITLVALIVVAVLLWQRVEQLRERVGELERATLWAAHERDALPTVQDEGRPSTSPRQTVEDLAVISAPPPIPARVAARVVSVPAIETVEGHPVLDAEPETRFPPTVQAIPTRRFGFEDIFGRQLPIWAGGITLAVCGLLIVKYSIDAGLLSPLVRIVGGFMFGAGLIAGAEAALRNDDRVRDPRVRQALAGAGIATLYGSILVAANVYHLVGPIPAFVGLAAVTLLAALLSIRFGAPSAILGLVGGLAAPALVGAGEPNVPLLAFYLSLTVGGLATLGRGQRWPWLGVAALTGGFGWGLVLVLGGVLDATGSLSIGLFLLLLGIALPVLLFGGARGTLVRAGGAVAATAQLALLVATGGFAPLHWALFGLLSGAIVWLSRREAKLADLPLPALAVALLLMAVWPAPTAGRLALVLAGAALIYGGPALWRLWRETGRLGDAGAIGALAVATLALPLWHFDPIAGHGDTLLALLGAMVSGGAATMGWRVAARGLDQRFALLVSIATGLIAAADALAAPPAMIAPAWAVIAGALLLFAAHAKDRRIDVTAWLLALLVLPALLVVHGDGPSPVTRATGWLDGFHPLKTLRWLVPAAIAALFARRARSPRLRDVSAAAATLLAYVGLAQVTPPALLPLLPAIGLVALGWWRRADAATVTAGVLAALWAMAPLGQWLLAGAGALAGVPLLVTALPTPAEAATHLLAPGVALAALLWRGQAGPRLRPVCVAGVALLGVTALHIVWKQLFAIATLDAFTRFGMAERTAWEALLAFAAVAFHRRLPRVAQGLGATALAHFAWFTLLVHNPLLGVQAVGRLPVANLLLPAYGIALALLWAAGREALPGWAERARQIALMLVIGLFTLSELRQLLHGSLSASGDFTQAEDIARSILAILLAIGFLQWGIRKPNRDWRVASLLLMLAAVVKVFLFDTSGLDGLLRIGSFAALGFSLIGIGWLYSRYLPADVNPSSADAA